MQKEKQTPPSAVNTRRLRYTCVWFHVAPDNSVRPSHQARTHATHLVVLGTVAEDQTYVSHQLPRVLVVLGVFHLKLLLHQFQVHGSLDDLVVVGDLEDAEGPC